MVHMCPCPLLVPKLISRKEEEVLSGSNDVNVRKLHKNLPLFLVQSLTKSLLYFPGHLSFLPPGSDEKDALSAVTPDLWNEVRGLEEGYRSWMNSPYSPTSLLIYLTDECDGSCSYCYSRPKVPGEGRKVPLAAVREAAQRALRGCLAAGVPLRAAIHGGGEPTLHPDWVIQVLDVVEDVAEREKVPCHFHLSTHGQIPLKTAEAVGKRFQTICLSCDGPPEIHLSQRSHPKNPGSMDRLIACSRLWTEMGVRLSVRSTVTPLSVTQQEEMVQSHHELLGVSEMRFEPVYGASHGPKEGLFSPKDADRYVSSFLGASRLADRLGCELTTSGVRLDELHGPYCSVLSQVLHVNPDGRWSGCFFETEGTLNPQETEKMDQWRRMTGRIPDRCKECINLFHCARGCPDWCLREKRPRHQGSARFRCLVNQKLTRHWLLEAAEETIPETRSFPSPSWTVHGVEEEGKDAWYTLKDLFLEEEELDPISVYVHVPFCVKRCPFCDCRATELGTSAKETMNEFTERLLFEISSWDELSQVAKRPVTTIHFGGGTPGVLGRKRLDKIRSALTEALGTSPETVWALESTCSLLTPGHLCSWKRMGFRRLHVGVQSLQEKDRCRLGRRGSSKNVLRSLSRALDQEMIVSVDLLYGIPGQTMRDWLSQISALRELGVHGFSLYQLQVPPRAVQHWRQWGGVRSDKKNTFPFLSEAEAFLLEKGYEKRHFVHYALPEDKYLYYLHWNRGENLMALGPTADGIWEGYRYRHREIQPYLKAPFEMGSFLQGGLWEGRGDASRVHARLMAGALSGEEVSRCGIEDLVDVWTARGLMRKKKAGQEYRLTALGSWEISRMLEELEDRGLTLHSI